MFAYARLSSILTKASKERGIDLSTLGDDVGALDLKEESERALAFELVQMGDTIKAVLAELMPCRVCDYLSSVCVKFTDFVTKCHVLNSEPDVMRSRLVLIEATRKVMAKCFELLGIEPLDKI
jgi:arginyl-tRNA synthetase